MAKSDDLLIICSPSGGYPIHTTLETLTFGARGGVFVRLTIPSK